MSSDLMLIFLIAISLFAMQVVGDVFQIKNYKAAIRRVYKKGNVGIGQKKGWFSNGNIAMVVCDDSHIITTCEAMNDKTFLAEFHPVGTLLRRTINGVSIDKLLEQFRSMDSRKQGQHRGYIQTLETLELRFQNAAGAREMDMAEYLSCVVMD